MSCLHAKNQENLGTHQGGDGFVSDREHGTDNGGGDNKGTGNEGDVTLLPSMGRAIDSVGVEENEEAGSGNRGGENEGSSAVGDCELTGKTPGCGCDVSAVMGHGSTSIGGA